MDNRKLQKINQDIVDQTKNIHGDDIRVTFSDLTVKADRAAPPRELTFVKGNSIRVYLDKILMPAGYPNKTLQQFVQAICSEYDLKLDMREPPTGMYMPFSFPLAQKYDVDTAPPFFITTEAKEALKFAFPLDGSSPPTRIVGGQSKYPLKMDRPCMVISLDVDLNNMVYDMDLKVFDPLVIDVKNTKELSAPVKQDQFNELIHMCLQCRAQAHALSVAHASIVEREQVFQAFDSYAAKYDVRVRGTDRLIPAMFQQATDIAEDPTKVSYMINQPDSFDFLITKISDASFADAVTKFKRVFGDGAHAVSSSHPSYPIIRVPNAAILEHLDVLKAAMDTVFTKAKILQGYQKYTKHGEGEPYFDKLSWEEKFEEQNKYFRQDKAEKLDAITNSIHALASREQNPKLKKAEDELVLKLSSFSTAALRADTTQAELNAKSEEVRKAIAKVEYRSSGLIAGLFAMDYKKPINELQTVLCRSQAYKK